MFDTETMSASPANVLSLVVHLFFLRRLVFQLYGNDGILGLKCHEPFVSEKDNHVILIRSNSYQEAPKAFVDVRFELRAFTVH